MLAAKFLSDPPRCDLLGGTVPTPIAPGDSQLITWTSALKQRDPTSATSTPWLASNTDVLSIPTPGRYLWTLNYKSLFNITGETNPAFQIRAVTEEREQAYLFGVGYDPSSNFEQSAGFMTGQWYFPPSSTFFFIANNEGLLRTLDIECWLQMTWIAVD